MDDIEVYFDDDQTSQNQKSTDLILEKTNQTENKPSKCWKRLSFLKKIYDEVSEWWDMISTLFGIQLYEDDQSFFEKVFASVAFLVSLVGCAFAIIEVYNAPIKVSPATSQTNIWEIPFPAVTICPEVKIRVTRYNYTYFNKQLLEGLDSDSAFKSKKQEEDYDKASLICDNNLHTNRRAMKFDAVNFLYEISPTPEETFKICQWGSTIVPCQDLFVKTITKEGICFTFNMLGKQEIYTLETSVYRDAISKTTASTKYTGWTLEKGYSEDISKGETFPKRSLSAGAATGLSFYLRNVDKENICRNGAQGFRLAVHRSDEVPEVSVKYAEIPLNKEMKIAITSDMTKTSSNVEENADPLESLCFFNSKRKLIFHKLYTKQNCDSECMSNFTMQNCQCVGYYMPRGFSSPICGPGSISCIKKAEANLILREANASDTSRCNCLPPCYSLVYSTEVSSGDLDYDKLDTKICKLVNGRPKNIINSICELSKVTIFFKDGQFLSLQRSYDFRVSEFVASVGALLGMFVGISLSSIQDNALIVVVKMGLKLKQYTSAFKGSTSSLASQESSEKNDENRLSASGSSHLSHSGEENNDKKEDIGDDIAIICLP